MDHQKVTNHVLWQFKIITLKLFNLFIVKHLLASHLLYSAFQISRLIFYFYFFKKKGIRRLWFGWNKSLSSSSSSFFFFFLFNFFPFSFCRGNDYQVRIDPALWRLETTLKGQIRQWLGRKWPWKERKVFFFLLKRKIINKGEKKFWVWGYMTLNRKHFLPSLTDLAKGRHFLPSFLNRKKSILFKKILSFLSVISLYVNVC